MEPDRIRDVSHDLALDQEHAHDEHKPISRRVMRKARAGGEHVEAAGGSSGFAEAINAGLIQRAAEGSGHALPDDLRGKFEQSLGTDLGGVRVHTDSTAAEASQSLGARAYAMGQDVFMGAGQYNPSSPEGAHLLAHEVAHTVQQRGAVSGPQTKLEVSSPGDAHETDADNAADVMVRGEKASVTTSTGIARKIQRQLHGHEPARAGAGHGHGHSATTPPATTTGGTGAAASTAPAAARDPRELPVLLAFLETSAWQNICDRQIEGVHQLLDDIHTENEPSLAETILASMINAAIGAAVGRIADLIVTALGPEVQRLIAAAGPVAAAAVGAPTATAGAPGAAATAPAAGAGEGGESATTGGAVARWVTDKISDRIKSELETSASAIAGNQVGHGPAEQFKNAQIRALMDAKESAQSEFRSHIGRFLRSPHGFEEAQAMANANADVARNHATTAQHATSLAEWARTEHSRSTGALEVMREIYRLDRAESSLIVNVDMPSPSDPVHVQSSRWPALNDATRAALQQRHAHRRIEEFNPAMRIRIFQHHWQFFFGEQYFDLVKIPGQTEVQFERTGAPMQFLAQRANPNWSASQPEADQLAQAQAAAQVIWLGIWQSEIRRLGTIGD